MQSILDPAYYSKHTTSAQQQPRVFVDRQGNMHDPDYRHFPSVSSYSSGSSSLPSSSSVELDEEEIYVDPFSPQARRSSSLPPTPSPLYHYSSPTPNISAPDVKPRRCGFKKCHRHSMDSYIHESDEEDEYLSEEEEEEDEEDQSKSQQQHDKSCPTHSVKRQLQSVSLSLSVSAFRARRKVKEALRHHHHRS